MTNQLTTGQSLKQGEYLISTNRFYKLLMQPDGNLVVYTMYNYALWNAKTRGKGGTHVLMQPDGNLVVYTDGEKAVWNAKTRGKGGVTLIMQDDGNLVLYDKNKKRVWSTGTNHDIYKKMATTWMEDNKEIIGPKKLKDICITGSHDAGMYTETIGGTLAPKCSTLTQSEPILLQLCFGARYFDIRPVIASGQFYTGHYSNQKKYWIGYQGANGESIADIIRDINFFTENTQELIILQLSHDFNTDKKYKNFEPDDWQNLFKKLSEINNLFTLPDVDDLTDQTLETFVGPMGSGKSAVIVIVPHDVDLGSYKYKGFYPSTCFDVINEYADTNDVDKMIEKEVKKMNQYANDYFLLSWTLTQQGVQPMTCAIKKFGIKLAPSVRDLADKANVNLVDIKQYITPQNKPNIFYIDNIVDNQLANIVVEINNAEKYVGESSLNSKDFLQTNEFLASANGAYKLLMQPDGNLVLYDLFDEPIWNSKTRGDGGVEVMMQPDGNLVISDKNGEPVWSTGTRGKGGVRLVLQDDRNLVMYNKNGKAVWQTKTNF